MAKTKQVFNHDELARVWLRQSQDTGHVSGGSMYFTGDTIYSYGSHFPIARLFDAPNGEQVILVTTQTYSPTTSRHQRVVYQAIRNSRRRRVYCYDVRTANTQTNLNDFKSEMDKYAALHAKARKPGLYSGSIFNEAEKTREYCEVMCIPVPSWALLPSTIEAGKPLIAAMLVHQEEINHV